MKNISWVQSIITAVITIGVTVIAGIILYYFQYNSPKLIYSYDKILPFESDSSNLSIYHFDIQNSGNSIAEEIIAEIDIKPAQIKRCTYRSDFPLDIKKDINGSKLNLKLSSLNPKEGFKTSLLVESKKEFPEEPIVKLKAKGILGEEVKNKPEENVFNKYFKYLMGFSIFVTFLSLTTRSFVKSNKIGEKHTDDQNKVIAYILGIHGLDNEVERLLAHRKSTAYWSEVDRLTSLAINSDKEENLLKTKSILKDLLEYAYMADSTKGIAYYNLARIEKKLGGDSEVENNLEEAKKHIPELLETRLMIDPLFKQINSSKKRQNKVENVS